MNDAAKKAETAEADFAYVKSLLEEAIEFGQIRHSPKYCWTVVNLICSLIRKYVIARQQQNNPHFDEMVFIARQCIQLYGVIYKRVKATTGINEALDAEWDRKVRGELDTWNLYRTPYYEYKDYTAYMEDKLIRVELPKDESAYEKVRVLRGAMEGLPALDETDANIAKWMAANCPAATVAEVDPIMQNIVFL